MKPEQVNQSAERLSALVSAAVLRSRRAASEARRAFDSQDGLALPSDDQLFCGEPSETAPLAGHFFFQTLDQNPKCYRGEVSGMSDCLKLRLHFEALPRLDE